MEISKDKKDGEDGAIEPDLAGGEDCVLDDDDDASEYTFDASKEDPPHPFWDPVTRRCYPEKTPDE